MVDSFFFDISIENSYLYLVGTRQILSEKHRNEAGAEVGAFIGRFL